MTTHDELGAMPADTKFMRAFFGHDINSKTPWQQVADLHRADHQSTP